MDETLLALLAKDFPSAEAVSTEIINLHAILCLPKGTEYFFSDPHGEAEAFGHLLNTASGVIRDKIEGLFARSVPAGAARGALAADHPARGRAVRARRAARL